MLVSSDERNQRADTGLLLTQLKRLAALFCTRGKNSLEMRTLFFPRNNRYFDVLKSGRFEKLVELHFAEAEPVIGVKLTGALEAVTEQIQDHDPSTLAQHAIRARD